jgi:hypothetical protein
MKFDELVNRLLSEFNLQSVHLVDGPARDGFVPNGFMGNINKQGPNHLVGNMWYRKDQKKNKKKLNKKYERLRTSS